MIHCHHCGTDNLDGTEHCDGCGKLLLAATAHQSSRLVLWVSFLILPFYVLFQAIQKPSKKIFLMVKRFLTVGSGQVNAQLVSPATSPFSTNLGRYEATVPLTRSFRYGYEPVSTDTEDNWVCPTNLTRECGKPLAISHLRRVERNG